MAPTLTPISTKDACPPAGPYSQAILCPPSSRLLFISGQIAMDTTGALVGDTIAAMTEQCIANVRAILAAAGAGIDSVSKVTVFLADMKDFAEMNGVFEKHFTHKPARSCVAVKELPKGAKVEVECMAIV